MREPIVVWMPSTSRCAPSQSPFFASQIARTGSLASRGGASSRRDATSSSYVMPSKHSMLRAMRSWLVLLLLGLAACKKTPMDRVDDIRAQVSQRFAEVERRSREMREPHHVREGRRRVDRRRVRRQETGSDLGRRRGRRDRARRSRVRRRLARRVARGDAKGQRRRRGCAPPRDRLRDEHARASPRALDRRRRRRACVHARRRRGAPRRVPHVRIARLGRRSREDAAGRIARSLGMRAARSVAQGRTGPRVRRRRLPRRIRRARALEGDARRAPRRLRADDRQSERGPRSSPLALDAPTAKIALKSVAAPAGNTWNQMQEEHNSKLGGDAGAPK